MVPPAKHEQPAIQQAREAATGGYRALALTPPVLMQQQAGATLTTNLARDAKIHTRIKT